jgi:hypothetical protein
MLPKYLEDIVEQNQNEPAFIAPICEFDAKIIQKLEHIFKLTHYYELSYIIEQWKQQPDEKILYLLDQWIQDGSVPNKTLMKLGDVEINMQYLQSITLVDSYDTKNSRPLYKIIINKDESEKLLFANTEVVFLSENKRRNALEKFKEKTKYLKIRFI